MNIRYVQKSGILFLLLAAAMFITSCVTRQSPEISPGTISPQAAVTRTPTSSPTVTHTIVPSPTSTIAPSATAELPVSTPTEAPQVWYSRPEFPADVPVYAQVIRPSEVVMYASLEAAANASQAVYRFAYDTVYVTIFEEEQVDGIEYARIQYDGHERWIRADRLTAAKIAPFAGIILKVLPEPHQAGGMLAIVLTDTFSSTSQAHFRGEGLLTDQIDTQTGTAMFGESESIALSFVALVPLRLEREDTKHPCRRIVVDVSSNYLAAYDADCNLQFATLISTGLLPGSTPTGIYRIATKEVTHTFRAPPEIRKTLENYIFENVPYTMIFSGYYAVHSVYWHNAFGTSTSHGCINMSLADARWLFEWAAERDWLFIQW